MKKLMTIMMALMAFAANGFAASPDGEIARLTISGGFMAPGAFNTTSYGIDSNGTVIKTTYRQGDFGPATTIKEVIGHLNNAQLRTLEKAIAKIEPGVLVDQNPEGPNAADMPDYSYQVIKGDEVIAVAAREGNGHLLLLQNVAAPTVKRILDNASSRN